MPIRRASTVSGQPSPDRQSVLSFVSPNVADLLFYETVDAKTVGAGSGKTITGATWASTSISVVAGIHEAGYTVTVTSVAHGFVTGDVVTIEGLGDREDDSAYSRPTGTHKIAYVDADTFTYFVSAQPDAASPLDVTNNPYCYKAHPSYGTAHPDTENFPKHKLCHVKQADTEGLFFEYYYAAERHHQDNYNFEFSQADLGGNQYDTVVRTYVNLRSDFSDTDGEYQAGDAMPAIPAYVFGDTYILMTRQQKRIGDAELDSLFVIEQRVYFKDEDKISFTTHPEFKDELSTTETLAHVGKTGIVTNAGTVTWSTAAAVAIANWGVAEDGSYDYAVEKLSNDWWKVVKQQLVGQNRLAAPTGNLLARRPYAMAKEEIHTHVTPVVGDVLFYVTKDRPADDGDGKPDHPVYGSIYDIEPFESHKLCYIKQADPEGQYFQYYYAADRADQDTYNFEFSQADLGGNQYDTVVRTYVILRSAFDDTDSSLEAGDAMPDATGLFNDDYILMTRQQKRIGEQELDSLYVVEQRVYFKDEDTVSFTTHPEFKEELKTTEILAHVGKTDVPVKNGTVTWGADQAVAATNWGINITNTYEYAVQQLSNDWWKIVKQQIVGSNRLPSAGAASKMLDRRPYAIAKEEEHSHVTPVVGDVLFYVTVDRPPNASGGTPDHPAYGTAYGTAPFADHKLCFVKQVDPEGQFFQYYYAADRLNQDDYNFEFSQADLGGNQYDTVIRTYVNLRADFTDTDGDHVAGDIMDDPTSQFDDIYILMTRQQKRIGDSELDSLFVIEQRVYFKDEDKISFNTDSEFNDELKTTEILAHIGKTNVPTKSGDVTWSAAEVIDRTNWGIKVVADTAADDGAYNYEVQRLSNDWWQIIEQQIVGENLIDGISYNTNRAYSYPAELIGFRFTLISRRDGTQENSVTALEKDAFSGPILMTVNRQWYPLASDANPIVSAFKIDTYKPRSGSYSGALYSLSYSNVLTRPFTLIDTVGTGHPTYLMGAYAGDFFEQGSTPVAQPASGSIVNVAATSQQFRGGYLVETVTGVIP